MPFRPPEPSRDVRSSASVAARTWLAGGGPKVAWSRYAHSRVTVNSFRRSDSIASSVTGGIADTL